MLNAERVIVRGTTRAFGQLWFIVKPCRVSSHDQS